VIVTSHAETAIVVTMRFLSQIATLNTRGASSKMDVEDVHVDSHAEDNESGSKSECEISEKLEQRNREWSNEMVWTTDNDGSKRTYTDVNHACERSRI
jgi:hypothetical protein